MMKIDTLFDEFIETRSFDRVQNNRYWISAINTVRKVLPNMNSCPAWKDIYIEIIKTANRWDSNEVLKILVLFTIYLDENKVLGGKNKGLFAKNAAAIENYLESSFPGKFSVVRDMNFNPLSIIKPLRKTQPAYWEESGIFVIKSLTEEEFDLIMLYLSSLEDSYHISDLKKSLGVVFGILSAHNMFPTDIREYNDRTFEEHFNLIRQHILNDNKLKARRRVTLCFSDLIRFYIWIQTSVTENIRNANFKLYTYSVLKYQYIVPRLLEGYKVVNYSIYDSPPKSDKLILNTQKMGLYQTANADKITILDLSGIENEYLRQWVKECYWFDETHAIKYRTKNYNYIIDFVEPIDKKYERDQKPKVSLDDVLTYIKHCVSKNTRDSDIARRFSLAKYFLNFIKDKRYSDVDELLFRFLIYHDDEKNSYKETYTKEEIKHLKEAYKDASFKCENMDKCLLYTLYYYVIAIQSISEMRVSTILNLKVDCLVKTLDRKKHSEYKVVVKSKTSGEEFDEYPVTQEVKKLIDEVKGVTSIVRNVAMGVEKEYLFIYRRRNLRTIGIVRQDTLSDFHNSICKEYGIRILKLGAIRNYYMQQVSDYVTENNGDQMLLELLSGHSINVHIKHYDAPDIKEFCQRFYQVEIGSIELKGRVEDKNDKPQKNDVAHRCGHCSLEKCVLKGNLECLMCDKFVTTLDCIPFFEKEILSIDEMISKQSLQHEKEFLNNKKRLNVAYLTKLYELEANINESKIL